MTPDRVQTAQRMNDIYRWQRGIYDLTRKFYLLDRDRLIDDLDLADGGSVLEIGCGTGRNLIRSARRWPKAQCYGLDISTVMLDTARQSIARAGVAGRITLAQGDAACFEPLPLFRQAQFDRVVLSYAVSMIPAWQDAVAMAVSVVRPGGQMLLVDFGDQNGLPGWFKAGLRSWLSRFDVTPRDDLEHIMAGLVDAQGGELALSRPLRGYVVAARLKRPIGLAGAASAGTLHQRAPG